MKNTFFIGIDPSINSTGITIQYYKEDKKIFENFYIVKPNKLTKNESENKNIKYITYLKHTKDEDEPIREENIKTQNLMNLSNRIYTFITYTCMNIDEKAEIHVCIEGIAYGSVRTKSLCDLAALNHMIREKFIDNGIDILIVPPTEIKKFSTGKGNANKEVIINMFKAIHPEVNSKKLDDVADSYFMSTFLQYYLKSNTVCLDAF